MARYYELSAPPEELARDLGPGGDRVAALLHGMSAHLPADGAHVPRRGEAHVPESVAGAPVRLMRDVPAALLDRVDPGWLARLEGRRHDARQRLTDTGRGDRLELAEHVAMLVATPRLRPADPGDADALAISGAILWLVGTLVATALTDDRDDALAELITCGWWPVGPVDGAFRIAPLDLPSRPRGRLPEGSVMPEISPGAVTVETPTAPQRGSGRAGEGPSANLAVHLAAKAQREGWWQRPAFHTPERAWTHGEVHTLAASAASVLIDHGVRPGDRVLIAMGDGIAWVAAFLAAARLGAVAIPVNPDLVPDEHAFMAGDCRARLAVAEDHLTGRFDGPAVLTGERLMRLAATAPPGPAADVTGDAPLYAQYTSGTTGAPKAALHRHADPERYQRAAGDGVVGVRHDDVTLSVSKLFFAYGLGNALVFPLFSGSSAVLMPHRPSPAEIAEAVVRHGVTLLYGVPSAYASLVAGCPPEAFSSVRLAVSAGESLSTTLGARAREVLGVPVLDQLGSTEVGHAYCSNTAWRDEPGTIGRPLPGYEVVLRDENGALVTQGQGEIWVRGASVMVEYLERPEQTVRALRGGWLRTGDLAEYVDGGALKHCGRNDDMEMVGGITVSPLEIERVLAEHPAVSEVAVAVIADEYGARKLRAFVVPSPDADRAGLDDDLIALARLRLAPYKVPRSVEFRPRLPRTPTGKLRRFAVREGRW
ncbi:AMP-binding protein [Actinomadura sp. 3N407]|uniref:AMP-binding protein n=1 Tax=Actinomadura sp. 3N407 TaxID=3457423 RepID=UPI003FCDCE7F